MESLLKLEWNLANEWVSVKRPHCLIKNLSEMVSLPHQ